MRGVFIVIDGVLLTYEALPSPNIRTPAGTPALLGGLTIAGLALKHGGYGVQHGGWELAGVLNVAPRH